jgi:hypothetical protein
MFRLPDLHDCFRTYDTTYILYIQEIREGNLQYLLYSLTENFIPTDHLSSSSFAAERTQCSRTNRHPARVAPRRR